MLARAKSKAEAAAAAARVAAAGFDERHKVGEKATAAKAAAAAKASAAAAAAKEAKDLVASRASEMISSGPTAPSLGVVLVAAHEPNECTLLARLVRNSRESYLGGRYDVVTCASVAEAMALLGATQTVRAIVTRIDLPAVAKTHDLLLDPGEVLSPGLPGPVDNGPLAATAEAGIESAPATGTRLVSGVQVGGIALLSWCKMQPALAGVPLAILLPPPVDPLTNPPIHGEGILISFDAPLDAGRVSAALSDAASAAGADFIWKHTVTEPQVGGLMRLLGEREHQRRQLSRQQFPKQVKLRVWACTFNVACESFSEFADSEAQLEALIPPGYDVYLLALQEGVGDHFSGAVSDYVRRKSGCIMLPGQGRSGPRIEGRGDGSMLLSKYTGLVAYAREDLVNDGHVQIIRTAVHAFEGKGLTVKDVKESLGSKGGVAILLRCFDTTMVAISVHLAKEWHKVERKRQQYRELAAQLGAKLGHAGFQLHSQFHHVIWMGDFNYHIDEAEISPAECVTAISSGKAWELLGKYDEMSREIELGQAYVGFDEPQKTLDFYPSYKKKVPREKSDYSAGEAWVDACYDVNFKQQWYKGGKIKLRMPSWTDRVLWYSQPHLAAAGYLVPMTDNQDLLNVGGPLYGAVNDSLLHSDHSPVRASFSLTASNQCHGDSQRCFLHEVEIGEQVRVFKQGSTGASDSPIFVEALVPAPFEVSQADTRPTRQKPSKKDESVLTTDEPPVSIAIGALSVDGVCSERNVVNFVETGIAVAAQDFADSATTAEEPAAAEVNLLGMPPAGRGAAAEDSNGPGIATSKITFDTAVSRVNFTLQRGKLGFGMTITDEGVVKGYIKPEAGDCAGPAQQLGLPIGSRIISVQGQPVRSKGDIHQCLHQMAAAAAAAAATAIATTTTKTTTEPGQDPVEISDNATPCVTFGCHFVGLGPIEKIRRVFDTFDQDGDGLLCQDELQALALATGDAIVEGVYEMICSKVGCDPSRGLRVDDLIRVYCVFDMGEIDRDFAALGLGPPVSEVIQLSIEAARVANRSASDARRLIYSFVATEQAKHTACVRVTTAGGNLGEVAFPLRFPLTAFSPLVASVSEATDKGTEQHTETVTAALMHDGVELLTDGTPTMVKLTLHTRAYQQDRAV